jgi:hypothetical protein
VVHARREGEPADHHSAQVDHSGAFQFEQLPAGDYKLVMIALPEHPAASPVTVGVVANQRVSVTLVFPSTE